MAKESVLWSGRQWKVTRKYLETKKPYVGGAYHYWIETHRLLEDLPVWSWPKHMAEKNWVDLPDFCVAWRKALELAGMNEPHAPQICEEAMEYRRELMDRRRRQVTYDARA